jgi:hypothetical protein
MRLLPPHQIDRCACVDANAGLQKIGRAFPIISGRTPRAWW